MFVHLSVNDYNFDEIKIGTRVSKDNIEGTVVGFLNSSKAINIEWDDGSMSFPNFEDCSNIMVLSISKD